MLTPAIRTGEHGRAPKLFSQGPSVSAADQNRLSNCPRSAGAIDRHGRKNSRQYILVADHGPSCQTFIVRP